MSFSESIRTPPSPIGSWGSDRPLRGDALYLRPFTFTSFTSFERQRQLELRHRLVAVLLGTVAVTCTVAS